MLVGLVLVGLVLVPVGPLGFGVQVPALAALLDP
jgi:hypothetical protein